MLTFVELLEGLAKQDITLIPSEVQRMIERFGVERVSEARRRKIASLTRAVQNAPSETEAKAHWQKLQYLMFGI